jgi:hypothetical protein
MGKRSRPAGELGQQHGQRRQEDHGPEPDADDEGVAGSGVAGEEGPNEADAAERARATACDAGMMPRITTYVSSSHGFTLPVLS